MVAVGAVVASTAIRTSAPGRTPAHDAAQRDAGGGYGRRDPAPAAPRGGGEWSEVPPELEEQLRAQLAQAPAKPAARAGERVVDDRGRLEAADAAASRSGPPPASRRPPRRPTRRAETRRRRGAAAKPKRASTRKPAAAKATTDADAPRPRPTPMRRGQAEAGVHPQAGRRQGERRRRRRVEATAAKPKRASTRKPAAAEPA